MSGYQAPLSKETVSTIPGQTAATDADQVVARAPFAGVVSAVTLTPEAAVTGATATKRTFTLINKGQSGAGTTAVAVLDLVTGENLVAFDEKAFTVSAAPLNAVAEGDILALVETHASTGTAHSGGQVKVVCTRS